MVRPFPQAEIAKAQNAKVRRHSLQLAASLLLLVCLCAQVAETFDFWDQTLQTGNDVEYSLMVVALVVGAGFGAAYVAATVMRTVSRTSWLLSLSVTSSSFAPLAAASTGYSPPPPLRI